MRLMFIFSLLACRDGQNKDNFNDTGIILEDADNDGYDSSIDCDDDNPAIHPGSTEICDGIDNDCDGNIDDGVLISFFEDTDGDGFGNPVESTMACEVPNGYVTNGSDCDDNEPAAYPGNVETCDGIDNDCNDIIDDGLGDLFFIDSDRDGFGDDSNTQLACSLQDGLSEIGGDCNDNDPDINPLATETCDEVDNNCDGNIDEGVTQTYFPDQDEDGYGENVGSVEACSQPTGYVSDNTDCNDANTGINPGMPEICDYEDNNCDGNIDESSADDAQLWYADGDSDGYGDLNTTTVACWLPAGFTQDSTDCDDTNASMSPGETEVCGDGLDNNCDGNIDDSTSADAVTWYADTDNDTFGDLANSTLACLAPLGYTSNSDDCDDNDDDTYPGAAELCNGVDDDCDNAIDELAVDAETWYNDNDGDGFGDLASSLIDCEQPIGYVLDATDCNDNDILISPDSVEICDGTDNNCDGSTDENTAIDATEYFMDGDDDGYGDANINLFGCSQPIGYIDDSTDCDDNDNDIYPGAPEYCDGIDSSCDGILDNDDSVDALTWYSDGDEDTFGDPIDSMTSCSQPNGYTSDSSDCDDNDNDIYPGAPEFCNGIDDNCDQVVDEDTAVDADTWYLDSDTDGYGDLNSTTVACNQPNGYVTDSTDCNDLDIAISPLAVETCDGIDNNCNGDVDGDATVNLTPFYRDADQDGYGDINTIQEACSPPSGFVSDSTDCDDFDNDIFPNAPELCNGFDDNCDSIIDDSTATDATVWYFDNDTDGYGNPNVSLQSCSQPSNYVANDSDCDDNNVNANVISAEVCDGIDNDCNGFIDDGPGIIGTEPDCLAASCADIIAQNPSAQDGVYYIEDSNGQAIEAFCEMDFNGGGWLSVYNMMERPQNNSEAANMFASLSQNLNMDGNPVLPDSTTAGIHTADIDLSQYSEVVYGWAPSSSADVSRYATYTKNSGLVGECYLDGLCSNGATIATMTVYPTGSVRDFQTGNSPTYPHVGIGWSGQIICWGYDLNNSSYGHWANWYDTKSCCTSGNTSEIQTPGWRYVIYIR